MKREGAEAADLAAAHEPEQPMDGPVAMSGGAAVLAAEPALAMDVHPALRPLARAPRSWPWFVAATVPVILLGLVAWVTQLREGLSVTGMSNQMPWTLYIANFVFFIGASAGGIIVGGLAYALGMKQFKPVARLAEVTALTCLTLALVFITVDVGRPDRIWHLLVHGSITSPLLWDVTVVSIYGVLAFGLVYFSLRPDLVRLMALFPGRRHLYRALALGRTDMSPQTLAKEKKVLRALALLSIPGAVGVHTITAWILGMVKAQPGWHTAILAPLFIVSALVSGLAITILAAVVSKFLLNVRVGEEVLRGLGRLLLVSIPVLGYFMFSELMTSVYAKEPEGLHVFHEMALGRYAVFFWLTIGAQLLAFAMLAFDRRLPLPGVGVAALLVAVSVVSERWNIVVPALTARAHLPYPTPVYTPTLTELTITAAAYAGGVLVYVVLARLLPLVELEVDGEQGHD